MSSLSKVASIKCPLLTITALPLPLLRIAMTPSMEQGIEVIMLPEIITGLGNMFLALKNRSSHLRIQVRAPRSLKNPRSKQGRVGIIKAMKPIVKRILFMNVYKLSSKEAKVVIAWPSISCQSPLKRTRINQISYYI